MTFDEQLLEFPAIRSLLEGHAISDLGRTRVQAMRPMIEREPLLRAIQLVKEMMNLLRLNNEPPLHGLRDVRPHLALVRRDKAVLDPQELLDVKDFLETAFHTRRFFEPMQHDAPGLHALAMPLQAVEHLKRGIDEKIAPNATVRDHASEALAHLRAEITATETTIQRELNRMVRDFVTSGDLQDDFFTLRNDRYVLPVKTSNRSKVPGIIHDSSNTGETVFIEPFAILEHTNRLADLRLREREEIHRILLQMGTHVRGEMNALLTNVELLGELDFVLAKARFGARHHAAFPTVVDWDKPPIMKNVHHPLLYAHQPAASKPLNLGLDQENRALIISGPNAGGKTTALKTIGLSCLMVQCAVPAPLDPASRFPIYEDILANIGDEQNILEGQSTFSAHVRRIAQILDASGPGSLVLLDELGTATDPEEGGALAVAILEHLIDRGTLTVVSSHLGVLKNWAYNHPGARNASFRLSEVDRRPTYRITLDMVGISEALVVAEQAGLPAEVMQRARALRPEGEGDATALLLSLRSKETELEQELIEARKMREAAELRVMELEELDATLREDKRTYRQKIMQEKERELTELRAEIERKIAGLPRKEDLLAAKREIEQAQARARKQRDNEADDTSSATAVRRLTPGDTVYVRTVRENGIVQKVDEGRGQVQVALGKVVMTLKLRDVDAAPKHRDADQAKQDDSRKVFYKRPGMASSVIDLHGFRVEEAIDAVDQFIDQALVSGLNGVKLMHGQGSGALRRGLHEYLRTNPVVGNYRFATAEEGGGGVTVVEFK